MNTTGLEKFYKLVIGTEDKIEYDPDASPDTFEHYKKIYPEFEKIFDYRKSHISKNKVWRLYFNLNDTFRKGDQTNSNVFQDDFYMSGDTDFNFNEKKAPIFEEILKEDLKGKSLENAKEKLEFCKKSHHAMVNFSFMPMTGNLQGFKGLKCQHDRLDIFLYHLSKFYKTKDEYILSMAVPKVYERLKTFLGFFNDVYHYCNKVYHIENKGFVDRLIENGEKPIETADDVIRYMDLAIEYWHMRAVNYATNYYIQENDTVLTIYSIDETKETFDEEIDQKDGFLTKLKKFGDSLGKIPATVYTIYISIAIFMFYLITMLTYSLQNGISETGQPITRISTLVIILFVLSLINLIIFAIRQFLGTYKVKNAPSIANKHNKVVMALALISSSLNLAIFTFFPTMLSSSSSVFSPYEGNTALIVLQSISCIILISLIWIAIKNLFYRGNRYANQNTIAGLVIALVGGINSILILITIVIALLILYLFLKLITAGGIDDSKHTTSDKHNNYNSNPQGEYKKAEYIYTIKGEISTIGEQSPYVRTFPIDASDDNKAKELATKTLWSMAKHDNKVGLGEVVKWDKVTIIDRKRR